MKIFWRVVVALLLVLLLGAVGLFIAARVYLSSHAVAGQVSTRLQALLGAPVEVDSADVAMTGGSSLHGLRIFEAGDEAKQSPFVTVDGAAADVSALDLLGGKSPNEVTLKGASIVLHFAADGRLLTHMPQPKTGGGAMPHVRIENGKLTLNQDGRSPMVVQGIQADLSGDGADLKATGAVADSFWGDWTLAGSLADATGTVALTLTTKDVGVDKARLTGLPFIAPEVWREVLVEGRTPVDFNLHFQLKDDPTIHYRVALVPADARVHVESIQLAAEHASGKVVVDDNVVTLREVHGRFAGGELRTDADLDFHDATWKLHFPKVEADKVVVHELPALWIQSLRDKLDGELSGKAALDVALENGKVNVSGSGDGQIDKATVAGFPASEPIELSLVTEGGRIKFRSRESLSKLAMAFLTPAIAAPPPPPPPPSPAPTAPGISPTQVSEWLPDAVVWGTDRVVSALGAGLSTAGGWLNHKADGAEPTSYLEAKLSLEDVDLGELLRRLDVKLPFPVEGKLSFQVQAAIPINTPQDMKAYRLNGTATLPRLSVAGVDMANVHTRLRFENGVLELQELKGKAIAPPHPNPPLPGGRGQDAPNPPPPGGRGQEAPNPPPAGGGGQGGGDAAGSFEGTARMEVAPLGDVSADARVDHFPLAVLLNRLPGVAGKADGAFSGDVKASAPAKTLTDPATWRAVGRLTSERVEAYGLALTDASADVSVEDGKARATHLKGNLEKAPLTGEAELTLSDPWTYRSSLSLTGADLAAVQRLAPDFRPPFPVQGAADVTADLRGTLSPLTVTASGAAGGSDLVLNQFKVDSLSFKWDVNGDRVKVTDAKAKLFQGAASGSAVLPLGAATAGDVDLRLDDVDVQALARSLPAVPVRLQGRASGTVTATLPAAAADGERQASAKIDLSAKALRVQNIPTDNLHADVNYQGGVADYQLKGDSLGGHFTLEGKIPFREEKKAPPPGGADNPNGGQPEASGGRFQFQEIRLGRLWTALGLGASLGQVHGRASIDLPFRLVGPELTPFGTGRVTIRDLRLGDALVTESLSANLLLRDGVVRVGNLSASVGGGLVRGGVMYNIRYPERSSFNLELEQVDAAALLAAYPELAGDVQGPVNLRLRGRLGRSWRGSGEAALVRGHVLGVQVDEWRLPLSFTFSPVHGHGELTIRDSNAQLARGRATGQAELNFSSEMAPRLEGNVRFYNAELKSLLGRSGQLGSYTVGQVSGRVDFNSDGLRSADDLNATVDAKLSQSQALQFPVLNVLVPFLAPGQSATTFQQGELRGRLGRGVFRIEKLTLSSAILRLAAFGTVTTQGRLDLEVTGATGRLGYSPAFLKLIGITIPAAGPIPLAVLLEASSLLSANVIHLRVTGTVRSPDVRFEPVRVLEEEAVRFFLLQSNVPLP